MERMRHGRVRKADKITTNRKSPRSDPAVQSSLNVPSLVLPSTLSRSDEAKDPRPDPLPARLLSRRVRRSELLLKARRRLRRRRVLLVLPRDKP
jgi:hypothetical protein